MSVRLLVVSALLSASWLFAQENQLQVSPVPSTALASQKADIAIVPLRIGPLGAAQATVPSDPLGRLEAGPRFQMNNDWTTTGVLLLPHPNEPQFLFVPDLLPGDSVCLKIRSYVMKRDSRDSDSTHLVGYSTCQPASRYRLRTTEIRSSSPDR